MQKTIFQRSLLAGAVLLAAVIMAPAATNAHDGQDHAQAAKTATREKSEAVTQNPQTKTVSTQQVKTEQAQTKVAERSEAKQAKLSEAKLKSCQNREQAIQNILTRMSDRGSKQLEVFNKISERTQTFYADKGKVLDNYDALLSEVNAKQAAAQTAVQSVKGDSQTFDCEGDNPKGMADVFKSQLKTQNAALKEYRTAIKNLIVGVKSVQSTASDKAAEGSQE